MTAKEVFGLIAGIAAAIALTVFFDQYVLFLLALVGGIAGGVLVYRLIVRNVNA